MGIFDFDLDLDVADLDGNGQVDTFEAALFFDEMEREDRAIERGLSLGPAWSDPPDKFDDLDDHFWDD